MRQILFFITFSLILINPSYCQTIKIIDRQIIDDFYNHTILDVNSIDKGYSILGREMGEDGHNYYYYLTKIDNDLNVFSQKKLPSDGPIHYYQDIVHGNSDMIFGLGYIDKEPMEMIPFVIGLDEDFNTKFQLFLDEKHEGGIKGFFKNNKLYVITNNNSDYIISVISKEGSIIDTKALESGYAEMLEDVLLYEKYFLIYGWSLNNEHERFDIIQLDYNCNIINKISTESTSIPYSINKISDENCAVVFESIPSEISIYNSNLNKINDIKHIRHDYKYRHVIDINNSAFLYAGLNIDKLTAFIVKNTDVISKVEIGDIGIWGNTILERTGENDFLIFTDKKRSSDFESNIEVIKLRIE